MPEFWPGAAGQLYFLSLVVLRWIIGDGRHAIAPKRRSAEFDYRRIVTFIRPTTQTGPARLLLHGLPVLWIAIYFYRPNNGIGTYIVCAGANL